MSKYLDLIFGNGSIGATPEERAATSNVIFVRSQDELDFYRDGATGRTFTAREALAVFGFVRLKQIVDEGSSILASTKDEPARTLRQRRDALNLTQSNLARRLGMDLSRIASAEDINQRNPIRDLECIAMALSLDERLLTFIPGAGGDRSLAYRLRTRGQYGLNPTSVMSLSEASWVIAKENYFYDALSPITTRRPQFEESEDYGSAGSPAHERAAILARQTRQKLGLGPDSPIDSMRSLCMKLGIPLVHTSLPHEIAGATLENAGQRGIVVNSAGHNYNNNVWAQRATVAHELGHLLYDPYNQLNSLIVDKYDDVEYLYEDSTHNDYVEARANAFAIELLAPKAAVKARVGPIDLTNNEVLANAIRDCMLYFGVSFSAMRFHLWNAFDRLFDVTRLPHVDSEPTAEWNAKEQYGDIYFPIRATHIERRGPFAGYVVKAERSGLTTPDTAAFYLNAESLVEYQENATDIFGMYPEIA